MRFAPQSIRTFFITTVTANRRQLFRVDTNALLLLDTLQHYREQRRYKLHAFVIMPDHLHLLLTPAPDISLEKALQLIKGGFSFRLQSKAPVWQRSFNEHRIQDKQDFLDHVHYIENNPVRARLAADESAYPYSSAFSSAARLRALKTIPHRYIPHIC